nr:sodium-dependent transporter [Lachnospiraceae bacterium]
SSLMDQFHLERQSATILESIIALVVGIIVCLGYNSLYFEVTLPNGSVAQILDIMDYVSNNVLMPVVAIGTCILIGWVVGPKVVLEEVEKTGKKLGRRGLYVVMIKFVAPILLLVLLLKSLGILKFI